MSLQLGIGRPQPTLSLFLSKEACQWPQLPLILFVKQVRLTPNGQGPLHYKERNPHQTCPWPKKDFSKFPRRTERQWFFDPKHLSFWMDLVGRGLPLITDKEKLVGLWTKSTLWHEKEAKFKLKSKSTCGQVSSLVCSSASPPASSPLFSVSRSRNLGAGRQKAISEKRRRNRGKNLEFMFVANVLGKYHRRKLLKAEKSEPLRKHLCIQQGCICLTERNIDIVYR